jgi:DNA-binding protein H-NS
VAARDTFRAAVETAIKSRRGGIPETHYRTMTKTYSQLMKQIDSLQREAQEMKRKEMDGVVSRIKEAIRAYGLTAADLGLATPRGPRAAAAPKRRRGRPAANKANGAAKYRDEAGNAWVGRGKRPTWLRDALAAGKQLSDFLVK